MTAAAIVRLAQWESRLAEYLTAQRDAVFAWGRTDCVLFAAGAVLAMTGTDPAADARGRYATAIGARRLMTRKGWADLPAMLTDHFAEIGPACAQRGDVVFDGRSLGVCTGRTACFLGEQHDGEGGLIHLPLARWERAWRVPFPG